MPLLPTNPTLLTLIKIASCTLIAGALGLVWGKTTGLIAPHSLVDHLFWIGSVALGFHGLEGIAAAILAQRLQENSLKAAIYTFWTGVAGISELVQQLKAAEGLDESLD